MGRRAYETDRVTTTESGYRHILLKSGRKLTFWDALGDAEKAQTAFSTAISRAFKLIHRDVAVSEFELDSFERRLSDAEDYLAAVRKYVEESKAKRSKQERIAALRNVEGRTPEEALSYLAKAAKLEKELADSGGTV